MIKLEKLDHKPSNIKPCIVPWCQRCRPSCRCACMLTEGQGLWSKPHNVFIYTNLGIWKKLFLISKCCDMIDPIKATDCAHHVCGMACWTCTWYPSSCLLCSSWCLFTMKEIKIKIRQYLTISIFSRLIKWLNISVCAHACTFYIEHLQFTNRLSTCDGST